MKCEGRERLNTISEWLSLGAACACREDPGFSSRDTFLFENTVGGCKGALLEETEVGWWQDYFFIIIFNNILLMKTPFEICVKWCGTSMVIWISVSYVLQIEPL